MRSAISKLNIILSIALFLIAVAFYFFAQNNISKICFEDRCFDVEIADTLEKKETGLMSRKYLEPNSGMLFLFEEESEYNFWMKNVLISLDIIWIDRNRKVVFIKENAEPCKIEPCEIFSSDENAKYVLEINGGMAEKVGLKVGDKVFLIETF